MHDYVFTEQDCLRYAITRYSDGVGVYCHQDPVRQKCSLCQIKNPNPKSLRKDPSLLISSISGPSSSLKCKRHGPGNGTAFTELMEAAKARKAKYAEENIAYVAMFEMALGVFNASCAYCLIENKGSEYHALTLCPNFKSRWDQYKNLKNSIRYPEKFNNKSCFFCHIPRVGTLKSGEAHRLCLP
jgi:hypothetical protein